MPSSSLWGCELKCKNGRYGTPGNCHPPCEDVSWNRDGKINFSTAYVILLVRMWVEIVLHPWNCKAGSRHPPCEDVSWNTIARFKVHYIFRHPPCEDVSWNVLWWWPCRMQIGHPPCEDVSWNVSPVLLFTNARVILLVRMWVEMVIVRLNFPYLLSSSLWGCELKFQYPNIMEPSVIVILLVRMWVEMWKFPAITQAQTGHPPCEDVSWNDLDYQGKYMAFGHPPCEDVSWNTSSLNCFRWWRVILLVRMWVEMRSTVSSTWYS